MEYKLICKTCDFPSMVESGVNEEMCTNPPCPAFLVPIEE